MELIQLKFHVKSYLGMLHLCLFLSHDKKERKEYGEMPLIELI